MNKRNYIIQGTIGSSILLLLLLQFFWLRSVYEKTLYDLRRDANILFRATLYELRDSAFYRNAKPLVFPDSARRLWQPSRPSDGSERLRSVQIIVRNEEQVRTDSVMRAITPFVARQTGTGLRAGEAFVINLMTDSLALDTLREHFRKALSKNKLMITFDVQRTPEPGVRRMRFLPGPFWDRQVRDSLEQKRPLFRDTLLTDDVHFSPNQRFQAQFTGIRSWILKNMAPQILFSFFLTAITLFAFYFIYRSLRSQQKLMALKNDFISNMTHELKTPMATVSVALEALRDFHALSDPQKTREYLAIAQTELTRLSLMTDRILKNVLFEEGALEIERVPVPLDAIVDDVIRSLHVVFEKRGARVTLEKSGLDFTILGSAEHLASVVYNLIDNGLKYSRANPVIRLALTQVGAQVRLQVTDEGVGIAPEYQHKIFEKFFRVPTGDVHNAKGYGLGLSYVASVVRQHGGHLHLTSTPGTGSTFTITLPLASPHP